MYKLSPCIIDKKSYAIGSIAITSSWNSEERGITFLAGLNCNGTEKNIFDCQVDANAPVCSSNRADANVVCPGL